MSPDATQHEGFNSAAPCLLYTTADADRMVAVKPRAGEEYRSAWRRDFARVIHSPAFRRLQGKTQIFPGLESDFFRNRMTHSLEVAQIAKSIALKMNFEVALFQEQNIDLDLVEIAGLCHDLGHPPFGHNGERALDRLMREHGGFEGNAQTLRILTRLEKRTKRTSDSDTSGIATDGRDCRYGLNLCFRTIASILKYDRLICETREEPSFEKGYYESEEEIVDSVKTAIGGHLVGPGEFKTIECQIMDLADDIAYSTYDFEDALKAGFLHPLDLLAPNFTVVKAVAEQVEKSFRKSGNQTINISHQTIWDTLASIFRDFVIEDNNHVEINFTDVAKGMRPLRMLAQRMRRYSASGYYRSELTSQLVGSFVAGIRCDPRNDAPTFSRVYLDEDTLLRVETLKHFVYQSLVLSSRVKVSEYRGFEVIETIFKAILDEDRGGEHLLPDDIREVYRRSTGPKRMRAICDFIAGMTERYALEFYGRLRSEDPQTIFKPL